MIDIVIPVYNAPDDLMKCVRSVLAQTDSAEYRLTLIDDGSPDPRIKECFAEIAKFAPQITQLFNPKNLGFTATVNRAFRETSADILLLNSDTIVTPQWLPEMRRCLESDVRIATVTPFSNNAEIASLPVWLQANPVPTAEQSERYARAARETSDGRWPDLPTGVGFCMLIRRQAIVQIGNFDEQTFGRGYGEENDWCQRAIKAGWRNVLCTSAYVVHTGSQSFSDAKRALVEQNIGKLNAKHPGYDLDVQKFIARDPVKPYRHALISRAQTYSRTKDPGVLHVIHGKDGGLEKHARDLIAELAPNRHYLLLALGERWTIEDHATPGAELCFDVEHQNDELWRHFLDGVCERFAITEIHVHHISGCRDGLLLALRDTALPYRVTLHDFYFACPAVHLLNDRDNYCGGETNIDTCQQCVNRHPHAPRVDVAQWREQHGQLLAKASHVVAPSQFTAQTTQRYFKGIAISTMPHVTPVPAPVEVSPIYARTSYEKTFAVVGAIGPLKGARNVEAFAERLRTRNLSARLVLIGYLDRQFHPGEREGGQFVIHGRYAPGELGGLLKAYDVSLVLFPAVGPETYGYVLSEVWNAGCRVVVSDVGTLADRVHAGEGPGHCLPAPTPESIDHWVNFAIALPEVETAPYCLSSRQKADPVAPVYADRQFSLHSLQPNRWLSAPPVSLVETTNRNGPLRKIVIMTAKLGVRFRHTFFGRFLERHMNNDLKRRLRSLVLR